MFRKKHYWRLDSKCITMFVTDTGNKFYKVIRGIHSLHANQLTRNTDVGSGITQKDNININSDYEILYSAF